MKSGFVIAATLFAALSAGARADILFTAGPGNFQSDENILFNDPTLPATGVLVAGVTNQSAATVDFMSSTSLLANGGQARVEGQTANYTDLSIGLNDPNIYFTTLVFNINASGAGNVAFTATEFDNTQNIFNSTVDGNGQNFFRFEAINGQRLKSVGFTTTAGVLDTRQTRIGGIAAANGGAIPEPGSLALLAMGGLPLLGLRRRRR